jgi:hypothetical protein
VGVVIPSPDRPGASWTACTLGVVPWRLLEQSRLQFVFANVFDGFVEEAFGWRLLRVLIEVPNRKSYDTPKENPIAFAHVITFRMLLAHSTTSFSFSIRPNYRFLHHPWSPATSVHLRPMFAHTVPMFDPNAGMLRLNRSLVYLGARIIAGLRLAREKQVNVRVIPTRRAIDASVDLACEIYNQVFRKTPERVNTMHR